MTEYQRLTSGAPGRRRPKSLIVNDLRHGIKNFKNESQAFILFFMRKKSDIFTSEGLQSVTIYGLIGVL